MKRQEEESDDDKYYSRKVRENERRRGSGTRCMESKREAIIEMEEGAERGMKQERWLPVSKQSV